MAAAEELLAELTDEANVVFAVTVLAIAKDLHRKTGAWSGEFRCPRCHTGIVRWAVSRSNGHTSVLCSTQWTDRGGEMRRCTSAME